MLVWSDEFNGTNTWIGPFWNPTWWPKTEADSVNTYIQNGALRFKLSAPATLGGAGRLYKGTGCGYVPGAYEQDYGYWEVRIAMSYPGDRSHVGYFALYPNTGWPPEIDFFETSGRVGDGNKAIFTQHWGVTDTWESNPITIDVTQYHIYGVEVTPTVINWYVDNILTATQLNKSPSTLWHPTAGLWACDWDGVCTNLPDLTLNPSYMDIDYLRIYDSLPTTTCSIPITTLNVT